MEATVKRKVYEMIVRPDIIFGLETMALRKRQEASMEVAKLKTVIPKELMQFFVKPLEMKAESPNFNYILIQPSCAIN